ncbi:MAG: response regulator [Helicobacteraceae bacterium]|nr:response regulator [Helicobacteraceae bacterium]
MIVVILDDSMTVRLTIEAYLDELGVDECDIFSTDDGEEALEYISEHGADIIFSDLYMPKMDGELFVDNLLRIDPKLVSRLFVISGVEDNSEFDSVKKAGAKRFIKKPINREHFNHFVKPEILKKNKLT